MPRDITLHRARVTAVHRGQWLLRFPEGERAADVTGRFRHDAKTAADYPVAGDWVDAELTGDDFSLIHAVHPRTNAVSRKAPGQTVEEQVLAANVDAVFIVTAFDNDFNPRRLERYLTLARQAEAEPVIVINKSDLSEENDPRLEEAEKLIGWGRVIPLSAKTGEGVEQAAQVLAGEKTGVFVGSSGVGKSTLLNAILGKEIQDTGEIRLSDGKGRHTTTARQMFTLPNGGFVIDTPGLREVQLWADESDLSKSFEDIDALADKCKFADCGHAEEPGCAVQLALRDSTLHPERWQNFIKLQKELAYLKRKQDPEQRANTKKRWKKIHKDMKDHIKRKRG